MLAIGFITACDGKKYTGSTSNTDSEDIAEGENTDNEPDMNEDENKDTGDTVASDPACERRENPTPRESCMCLGKRIEMQINNNCTTDCRCSTVGEDQEWFCDEYCD